jgi:hypothetical protein
MMLFDSAENQLDFAGSNIERNAKLKAKKFLLENMHPRSLFAFKIVYVFMYYLRVKIDISKNTKLINVFK